MFLSRMLRSQQTAKIDMKPFPGTTMASLRAHPPLIPLFAIIGAGMVLVVAYAGRLTFKAYDISWRKKPEPWNELVGKQYKFFNPTNYPYHKDEWPVPKY